MLSSHKSLDRERFYLKLDHAVIELRDYAWGVIVKSDIKDTLRKAVRPVARELDGHWSTKYKTYLFPEGTIQSVIERLKYLGASDYTPEPKGAPDWF